MFGVHPDLRTYVLTAFLLSTAVSVAGIASLFYGTYPGDHVQWPFIIFGIIALSSRCLGIVVVPRWYRHSTRVVSTVTPTSGRIHLEIESDSDSTSLYGIVIDTAEPKARVLLLMPSWPVQALVGSSSISAGCLFRSRVSCAGRIQNVERIAVVRAEVAGRCVSAPLDVIAW